MTAQTLGTAVAHIQVQKAKEAKGAESVSTKTMLQIQWSSTKSVCCTSACPVVQLHGAPLYIPTFPAALFSARAGMLMVTWS